MSLREAALALVSATVLGYEVVLVRVFAVTQWHHFAYLIISIALLGFGASGTWLAILERRNKESETRRAVDSAWFARATTLFALALPLSFWASQQIPFDPFLIVWDRRQLLYLGAYYLVLFVPFLFAGLAMGLLFVLEPARSARLYFFNLVGSGAGAALGVVLLALAPAERAALAVGALAQGGAALVLLEVSGTERARRAIAAGALLLMAAATLWLGVRPVALRISQYKSLSYALNLPGAHLVAQRTGPLGRVDVVASPAIRHAPGLSLAAPPEAATPPQLGLFVDADSAGAIARCCRETPRLAYLDWMSTAAPYFARTAPPQRVLVLGAGGGSGVWHALGHGAQHVDAVELDANVIALVRETFRDWAGNLYDHPQVRVHRSEARAFVEAADKQWDIIEVSLLDSFAAAAAGLGAVGENYLYTREAFETFLTRLAPGGALAVTRWVRNPPRDELRIFATAVAALEAQGLDPHERLAVVRSWATATLLIRRDPYTAAEISLLTQWARERLFDTVYFPGIRPEETNVFNQLDRDHYAEAMGAILAGGERRERYVADYAFHIAPSTDNRPYFFHSFRWRALPLMLRSVGAAWIPFVEWGFIILIATLVQAALAGGVFILLPLLLLRRHREPVQQPPAAFGRSRVFAYFVALGLGFLFVEMVLIQRLVFFLANPVYAVAVVLAGLLIFSGLGSGWAARRVERGADAARLARTAALIVAVTALVYAFSLQAALKPLVGLPLWLRTGLALLTMAPLAAMGIPFPAGLRLVGQAQSDLLPWAWAINGSTSVLATSLATLLAMTAGLPVVLLAAAGLYFVAVCIATQWRRKEIPTPQAKK